MTTFHAKCPICLRDSIVGHGRRRKQAHDENHDRIAIRRGQCNLCDLTFTFLPPYSLPYTHYSLVARSASAQLYFVQNRSLENAAPVVKDADRVAAPSTVRRWFGCPDNSLPPFSFLRRTIHTFGQWFDDGRIFQHESLRLSWPTGNPVFTDVLAVASVIFSHPPSSPGNRLAAAVSSSVGGPPLDEPGSATAQTASSLLEYLQQRHWSGRRAGSGDEWVGLCPLVQGAFAVLSHGNPNPPGASSVSVGT